MFLTYGHNDERRLVHISEVQPGLACDLTCPFCGEPLVARQGEILAHHFAHHGPTCWPALAGLTDFLPSYAGYFLFSLTAAQRQTLQTAIAEYGTGTFRASVLHPLTLRGLADRNFLRTRQQPGRWGRLETVARLTEKAWAFVGQLSLAGFLGLMQRELGRAANRLQGNESAAGQTALAIIEQERARLAQTALYFVQLETAGGLLHKIGITRRDPAERMAEIETFVRRQVGDVRLTPLAVIPGAALVEGYFKARYAAWRYPLGTATEYFAFGGQLAPVLAELAELEQRGQAAEDGSTLDVGSAHRPRFRAVFERYDRQWNGFQRMDEALVVLRQIFNRRTGQAFSEECWFRRGKVWRALGELWAGDIIEFNATPVEGRLKRPTKISVTGRR